RAARTTQLPLWEAYVYGFRPKETEYIRYSKQTKLPNEIQTNNRISQRNLKNISPKRLDLLNPRCRLWRKQNGRKPEPQCIGRGTSSRARKFPTPERRRDE